MQVTVSFRPATRPDTAVEVADGGTIVDVLAAANVPLDGTLVLRDNKPVPEDSPAIAGETLLLLSSFSGG